MRPSQLETSHPNEPWMWREDWVQGGIRGHSGSQALLLWVMAIPWNGFIWALLWLLWGNPDKTSMIKVAVLFAILGVILLAAAVKKTLAWFRFGSSVLELAANPGVIGGNVEGRIRTRLANPPQGPVQLTLTCLRRRASLGKSRSGQTGRTRHDVRSDVIWQGGRRVSAEQLELNPRGLIIPVKLHIPCGLESTDSSDPDDQIIWILATAADIPGVDFNADFTVPVFATEASDAELTQEKVDDLVEREEAFAQPADPGTSWVPPVVVQPTGRGGIKYTFRLSVTLRVALTVTALALGVGGGSAALFVWLGEAGPFALLPGAFGALLLLATAVIWTFTSKVVIEGGTITVRKSVLGIPRTWQIPYSEVKAVRTKK
ncbi:MAG: hypothetical protein E4H38_07285, partial [Gemmatimonadales bacterium]